MTDQLTPDWRTWADCKPVIPTYRIYGREVIGCSEWPLGGKANMDMNLLGRIIKKDGPLKVGAIGTLGDVQFVVDHLIYEMFIALVHRIN